MERTKKPSGSKNQNRKTNTQMGNYNRDTHYIDFKDHFDLEYISSEKIQFVKHYMENKMRIDVEDEESLIEFSPIRGSVFGYLLADVVSEYEKYNEKPDVDLEFPPRGEE